MSKTSAERAPSGSPDAPLRNDEPLQYRRLIESLTDYAIFSLSVEGRITSWNSGATKTFGYRADEVLGRHYGLIFTAEDIANNRPECELLDAVALGKASCDGWHVRKDASRLWCTDTVQPILDEGGKLAGFTKIVRDSTETHEAHALLNQSEERLHLLIEGVTNYAIFSMDVAGNILFWNSGAEKIFGYTGLEICGKNFAMLYTEEAQILKLPELELAAATRDGEAKGECWHIRRDGVLFYGSGQIKRLEPDAEGLPRGFVKIAHDITERMRIDAALQLRALYDDLTQLPNRASFVDDLRRAIARKKRNPRSLFAVIFMDLDQFKIVNDSLGHAVGDGLLVHVARLLERCLRTGDVVARLGGDEFTILLSEIRSEAEAIQVAERIQKELKSPVTLGDVEVYTSASLGIAIGTSAYETAEEVLRDADAAMYAAKSRGRARHVLFEQEMHSQVVVLFGLQSELRTALNQNEFRLYYQPIVSLELGRVYGFEALVRWQHPQRGLLYPKDFIGVAESIGLIGDIDLWVLEQACRQLRIWQTERSTPYLTVNVNVSSKLFAHERLIGHIEEILANTHLSPGCLKLEITETVIMANIESGSRNISRLRELGIELSIDDFGTGYSSLSYLQRFPLATLKVDRSFVENLGTDARSDEIAQTIVNLARNLGLDAVAEGIETLEQLARLKTMGCAFGQGFLFSPAVPHEVACEFINRSFMPAVF